MEREYSTMVKGKVIAYSFLSFEKKHIANALKSVIKQLNTKIYKLENHPDNEGQVTFLCAIDDLNNEKKQIQFIIDEFS